MHIDHSTLDATQEILLQHLLGLLGMAHIGHIFLVHGVEVAALDPATLEATLLEHALDVLVGVDNEALGIRNAVAQQDACHALAGAILDAVARVNDQASAVFQFLQVVDRFLLATHGHDKIFVDALLVKLLFTIDVDDAPPLAKLLGGGVENCGVVSYVVRRVGSRTHDSSYIDNCHIVKNLRVC